MLILSTPLTASADPECRLAAGNTAKLCEELGHHVEEVTDIFSKAIPFDDLRKANGISAFVDVLVMVEDRVAALGRELREGDLEPITHKWIGNARSLSPVEVVRARKVIHHSSRHMARFQENFDAILTPTLGTPPIGHGIVSLSRNDLRAMMEELYSFMPFTQLANWTGQPAMSVPLHWSADGLPVGVQFMGRFGDESTLFRLAKQLEDARPWADRRPKL